MMPRRLIPLVMVGAVFLFLLGYGGGGGAPKPTSAGVAKPKAVAVGDIARGREVYMGTCAFCHGPSGKGIQGFGKNLVNQSPWMKQQDDAELIAFIKTGRAATDPLNETGFEMLPMGGNPTLTDADLADVVAYIRSLQAK